jgi:hypothetical protein
MTGEPGVEAEPNGHWMAWQARSAERERLVRQRFVIALVALSAITVAFVAYLLPTR